MAVGTGLLPDRYTGARPIGRGGMGEIYRVTDTVLGRAVAVKVLAERYARDEAVRERFTREALAAARLSGNPSIVTIFDVGEWRDRPFIVMEYLSGGSLEEKLRGEGPPAPRQALDWLEQAAGALDAAHREGVVHRDVKPANLLLDRRGDVHVADFGIASAAGFDSLTQTGTVLGTAAYLSPEQAQGKRATPASDLYALGVVAFELLTGRRPFAGDSVAAEAVAHVTGDVPPVAEIDPSLPRQLDDVFALALAKDPAERYGSCAELVAALRAAFDEGAGSTRILAAPVTAPTRVIVPRRRSARLLLLVALLLLAAGIGALASTLLGGSGARHATPPSRSTHPATTQPPPTATTAAAPTPDQLNAQGYQLMQRGDYRDALPLLQRAVQGLQGQPTDVNAGYANYNLGVTLTMLGQCAAAIPYFEAAKRLEPGRPEIDQAEHQAQQCAAPPKHEKHGKKGGGG
jgi:eukaryotic-like serine/threonine-protein kinase